MEFNFNFEGKNTANVLGISNEDASEFSEKMAQATREIISNVELFSFSVSKEECPEHEGSQAWHMGKILDKLLTCATNDNERLLVISSLEKAANLLSSVYDERQTANKLKSIMGL